MLKKISPFILSLLWLSSYGQSTITWNFTGSTTGAPSSSAISNLTVSNMTIGNTNGTVTAISSTSVSTGYTGASGTNNIGNAARVGALSTGASGSAFVEFTLTPASGFTVELTNLSFGVRSTTTGPAAWSLRTSDNSYGNEVVGGTNLANGSWILQTSSTFSKTSATGTALTFRIYGYNGTGTAGANTINWRLDDINLTVNVINNLTPTITLNNNTQITAGNANQSELNHLLSRFAVDVTTANASLTRLGFTLGGTFAAGDLTNLKLFTSTTNTFPGGSALASISAGSLLTGDSVNFTFSQTCSSGVLRYFWIATDISATAGVGRTVNVPSLGASNFTFAAGTPTGTIDAGGAQTFVAAAPEIAVSSPTASTADITQGVNNQPVYRFDLAVTVANATLNGLTITTAGTYVAADLTNLKAWYSADATFNAGSDILLSTKNTGLAPGSQIFPSFASQVISNGSTGYIFITADLPLTATAGNTLSVDAVTNSQLSFLAGNVNSTANGSGTKTIIACTPTNVTSLNLTAGNGQIAVSWVNPVCFDELLIVAKPSSSIAGTPSGDGSTYTANLAFGTGGATAFDVTGFVVYKGSTSPQTITGLTNGTTYFVDVFTRRGSVWSAGVESSATPNLVNTSSTLWNGGSNAWLTAGNWASGLPSSTLVAQFGSASQTTVGMNMNTATLAQRTIAAIEFVPGAIARTINNSSGTASNTLIMSGAVVGGTENVILRNNSSNLMTIADGTSQTLGLVLNNATNNIIDIDSSGGITISCAISGSNPLTLAGIGTGVLTLSGANSYTSNTTISAGTLRLNRTGGTTLPATNNVTVNGGTLRVSTNQELNDLTVGASGTLTIDASTTLTINDDLSLSGTLNNSGTLRLNKAAGNTVASSSNFNITSGTLRISSNQTLNDLTVASGATLTIDAGVTLTVTGSLSLSGTLNNAGTLNIGANTVALAGTVTGSGVIRANGATLNITGSGAMGTLNFDQTNDGATNSLVALSINRSSTGTVTLGNKLNVTETVTLTDGVLETAGHLHLKSTSAASTARINGGTNASITGNVNFERNLPWAGAGNNGFRFATHSLRTAPVINTISGLPVATNTLILFNEANNNYEGISNRAGTWPVAAGYGVWTNAANTLTYSGEPQLNTVGPISLPRTNAGWHYLGNPFPSVLDWDAVSRTQVDNAIYVWEKDNTGEGNGVWGSYVNGVTANNGSQYIAPGQGFAVRSQVGSPEITFPAAARTNAANPAYYRQASVQGDLLRVRITKASNQFSLETVIRFRDQATASFDGTYDAQFVSDFSNASPDLYTTDAQGEKYSINSMAPLGTQPVLVPLQLETFGAGNYSFTFNSSAMLSGASIQLEDTKTGTFTQIANGDVINFTAGANDATGRFRLHFNGLATSVASNRLDQVQVYTFEGKLYIRGMEQAEQLRIVDMTGRVVYQNNAVQLSAEGLHPQLSAGAYLVQIVGKQGVKTAKVQF